MFECFFCDYAISDKDICGAHIAQHLARGETTELSRFLRWLKLEPDAETDKLMIKFIVKAGV